MKQGGNRRPPKVALEEEVSKFYSRELERRSCSVAREVIPLLFTLGKEKKGGGEGKCLIRHLMDGSTGSNYFPP